MTVYVFTGPTLAVSEARQHLEAVYLPPAAMGDVYRVALQRPQAIGIIDGYFDSIPSVWHKEILWAMREGVHIFGSASMGALRAAELAAFGMKGVGVIYEWYAQGELEDDDEVAVTHGPAETGYSASSVALANIRATLAEAERQGVTRAETHLALLSIAKGLFYPDRSYARILSEAATLGVPADELAALRAWLPQGQLDQKRLDALAMLGVMREWLTTTPPKKRVRYHFEHTVFWERARISAEAHRTTPAVLDTLLDEARLEPGLYHQARQAALSRALAQRVATQHGYAVADERLRHTVEAFRGEKNLLDAETARHWLADHHLDTDDLARLMREEAVLYWAADHTLPDLAHRIVDELRLKGDYRRLYERAEDKKHRLDTAGWWDINLEDMGLTQADLLHWFYGDPQAGVAPADLARYAAEAGYSSVDTFMRALVREYCFTIYLQNSTGGS